MDDELGSRESLSYARSGIPARNTETRGSRASREPTTPRPCRSRHDSIRRPVRSITSNERPGLVVGGRPGAGSIAWRLAPHCCPCKTRPTTWVSSLIRNPLVLSFRATSSSAPNPRPRWSGSSACHGCRLMRDLDGQGARCQRHQIRPSPRAQAKRLWAVVEAADQFLECSVSELSSYADRRRALLTAVLRARGEPA